MENMKGLEIARQYYEQYGILMIHSEFSQYESYLAAGLAGQGSECFGFDDSYSRDHDFGPGFCIWIPERYWDNIGVRLSEAYENLPDMSCLWGITAPLYTEERKKRIGVHTVESFYESLIGRKSAPETNLQWLLIPDHFLAAAVNGEVFADPLGEFSAIRKKLLGFYPEETMKKKMAARCAVMAQAGQYNYVRSIRRKMFETAALCCCEFVTAALGALYLLNETYMPFYKWAFRGAEKFHEASDVLEELKKFILLSDTSESMRKILLIERICIRIRDSLVRRGWSYGEESFLEVHAERLTKQICDPQLKNLPIMEGRK
ncbi:DUF4037 domain-containing protein [Ruminococcus sp. CLA-AA-H200]|uniref:DUF4037 domain-containing protein n=1 Tax=Ruminococcus turbiniformis TaxID=2881258 RepID=A0ABS8FYI1_9FIRM|nr:DUF4037 domain-containing protein [Ruminococcus turbiniformis]MCC2255038.1 DUF4037 domain-containing protein [Ruminococcus turbiniformis]